MTDGTMTVSEHGNRGHGRASGRPCMQRYAAVMQLAGGRIMRRHKCMNPLAAIETADWS